MLEERKAQTHMERKEGHMQEFSQKSTDNPQYMGWKVCKSYIWSRSGIQNI